MNAYAGAKTEVIQSILARIPGRLPANSAQS